MSATTSQKSVQELLTELLPISHSISEELGKAKGFATTVRILGKAYGEVAEQYRMRSPVAKDVYQRLRIALLEALEELRASIENILSKLGTIQNITTRYLRQTPLMFRGATLVDISRLQAKLMHLLNTIKEYSLQVEKGEKRGYTRKYEKSIEEMQAMLSKIDSFIERTLKAIGKIVKKEL